MQPTCFGFYQAPQIDPAAAFRHPKYYFLILLDCKLEFAPFE